MSRLGPRLIAALAAAILAGAGWTLWQSHKLQAQIAVAPPEPATTPRPAAARARPVQNQTARQDPAPAATRAQPAGGQASQATSAEDDLTARRDDVVALLRGGTFGTLRWAAPARNDPVALAATVADVFGLSAAEKESLQRIVEAGKQSVYAAITEAATVTPGPDGSYEIKVVNAPEARLAADRMQAAIRNLLTEDRYEFYDAFGAKAALTGLFENVGMAPITFTVQHGIDPAALAAGRSNGPTYQIRRSVVTTTGTIGMSGPNRDLLASNLGPLADLLPPEF